MLPVKLPVVGVPAVRLKIAMATVLQIIGLEMVAAMMVPIHIWAIKSIWIVHCTTTMMEIVHRVVVQRIQQQRLIAPIL